VRKSARLDTRTRRSASHPPSRPPNVSHVRYHAAMGVLCTGRDHMHASVHGHDDSTVGLWLSAHLTARTSTARGFIFRGERSHATGTGRPAGPAGSATGPAGTIRSAASAVWPAGAPAISATPQEAAHSTPVHGWSPGTQAAKPARKLAKWLVAVVIIFWAVPIATRVEWVRQHDGPVTPVPYSLAVTVSVLAGLLLAPYMLGRRRPPSA